MSLEKFEPCLATYFQGNSWFWSLSWHPHASTCSLHHEVPFGLKEDLHRHLPVWSFGSLYRLPDITSALCHSLCQLSSNQITPLSVCCDCSPASLSCCCCLMLRMLEIKTATHLNVIHWFWPGVLSRINHILHLYEVWGFPTKTDVFEHGWYRHHQTVICSCLSRKECEVDMCEIMHISHSDVQTGIRIIFINQLLGMSPLDREKSWCPSPGLKSLVVDVRMKQNHNSLPKWGIARVKGRSETSVNRPA